MDIQGQGSSRQCVFTRMFVFDIWIKYGGKRLTLTERVTHVINEIYNSLMIEDKENINFEDLSKRITYICIRINELWRKCCYIKDRFLASQHDWLTNSESVILESFCQTAMKVDRPNRKRGRPMKDYGECSKRTQQRRRQKILQNDESMASAFNDNTARVDVKSASTSEVISLIVDAKLTKHQYMLIKDFVNFKLSYNMLPSYNCVLTEKQNCYPVAEKINVTESSAEVELQALLDHTASRLLESQKEVFDSLPDDNGSSNYYLLIGKWGFDGSTGHSEYKQSFRDSEINDDSNLFVTSYVPLQLLKKCDKEDVVIWKNPRPSSTRYCRPMRFQYKKETTEVSVEEERYFSEKISALHPTEITMCNRSWIIHHSLQLTMVDGKVCNALSNNSSTKCYICKATPKEMNDLDACVQKVVNPEFYFFGLSPLHSWIRFFEFFLHVSYRLQIRKWQVRGQAEKEQLAERKKLIQSQFRERMGLIVDKPKAGGSGTSNDGNTARKFFENPVVSSNITGIDKDLIERCAIILQALGSGYKINTAKFEEFAMETVRKIVQTYPWYYLPASVHKVLVHGSAVIDHALLSIGELSEEAAEARNKDIKLFRLRHRRKMSRDVTNRDLLNRLLLSSDPLITGLRKLPKKKKSVLSKVVLELLSI